MSSSSGSRQVRLDDGSSRDDHNGPALYLRRDGRLQAFWNGHFSADFYTRISEPRDPFSWGPRIRLDLQPGQTDGYTYATPIRTSTGLALFFRGAGMQQAYAVSRDGVNFSPARKIIEHPGVRPYAQYAALPNGDVAIVYTRSHPQESELPTQLYFARLHLGAGGGSRLEARPMPITSAQGWAWPDDIASDANGRITILYSETRSSERHYLHFLRRSGTGWIDRTVFSSGPGISPLPRELFPGQPGRGLWIERFYSAGAALDHSNPDRFYAARKGGRGYEIKAMTRARRGPGFSSRTVRTLANRSHVLIRPVVPTGPRGPLAAVWLAGYYGNYLAYQTRIAGAQRLTR